MSIVTFNLSTFLKMSSEKYFLLKSSKVISLSDPAASMVVTNIPSGRYPDKAAVLRDAETHA